MTHDELVAVVEKRFDLMNRKDVPALADLYAEAALVESPTAGTISGRKAIEEAERTWLKAFPDLSVTVDDIIVEANRVVAIARFSGTHADVFLGIEPTGKRFDFRMVLVHTIEEQRIVHERRFYDFSGLLIRLGVLKVKPG